MNASLSMLPVSIATGASNGSCSDAMTLLINDWLFHSEGGAYSSYWVLHILPFISNRSAPSSYIFGWTVQSFRIIRCEPDQLIRWKDQIQKNDRFMYKSALLFSLWFRFICHKIIIQFQKIWNASHIKVPFKENLVTRWPYLQRFRAAMSGIQTKYYLFEWGNPEIAKTACRTHN